MGLGACSEVPTEEGKGKENERQFLEKSRTHRLIACPPGGNVAGFFQVPVNDCAIMPSNELVDAC